MLPEEKKMKGREKSKNFYKTVFLVAKTTLQNVSLIMEGKICHDRSFWQEYALM